MTTLAFLEGIGSPMHWFIILVIALLLFGRRLPEVGRSLGKGITEFKKGLKDATEDGLSGQPQDPYGQGQATQQPYQPQQLPQRPPYPPQPYQQGYNQAAYQQGYQGAQSPQGYPPQQLPPQAQQGQAPPPPPGQAHPAMAGRPEVRVTRNDMVD